MYITVIRPPDKLKNEAPRCWLVPRWTQGWQVQAIPAPCEILQDFLKHPRNFKLLISIYWFVIMQTPCLSAALQSKLWKVENDVEIWWRHAVIRCQDIWELILAQSCWLTIPQVLLFVTTKAWHFDSISFDQCPRLATRIFLSLGREILTN